jgi:predicted permease
MPGQHQESIVPEGYQFPKNLDHVDVFANWVDGEFFETAGVPIVRGRAIRTTDVYRGQRVAVINEVMAQRYWPNQDPVGKRFRLGDRNGNWVQIVGIAKTGKYIWVAEPPTEYMYLALDELPRARMTLVARSFGDPAELAAPLREMVRGLDPNQPVYDVRTMEDVYRMRGTAVEMITQVVGGMGLIGLSLALVGLYGLMAYSVARRTREIGIRMAIGADRGSVQRMMLWQGFRLALAGLGMGLLASFAAEKAVMALFGRTSRDALAYAVVAPALLAVTMLAAWVPAWRASRVDPTRALRWE